MPLQRAKGDAGSPDMAGESRAAAALDVLRDYPQEALGDALAATSGPARGPLHEDGAKLRMEGACRDLRRKLTRDMLAEPRATMLVVELLLGYTAELLQLAHALHEFQRVALRDAGMRVVRALPLGTVHEVLAGVRAADAAQQERARSYVKERREAAAAEHQLAVTAALLRTAAPRQAPSYTRSAPPSNARSATKAGHCWNWDGSRGSCTASPCAFEADHILNVKSPGYRPRRALPGAPGALDMGAAGKGM